MPRLFAQRESRDVSVVPANAWRGGLYGYGTPSGVDVTPDSAMTVAAYFAAVRFRAFAVASLPKILYQRVTGGNKRRAVENSLYRVLHDEPNPDMSAFDLWAVLDAHVTLRGNAYAEIVSNDAGEVTALYPLRPDKMTVQRGEDGGLVYVYELPQVYDRRKVQLPAEKVLHLRGLTDDGVMGISQITYMRNAVGLAKATEEFGSRFFGSGAHPGVVLKHPGRIKDEQMVNRLRTQWEEMHSGLDNSHRAAILEEGMSVEKIGLSPEDSQFLQTRVHQIYEIARMTDVPPSMIFELTNANFASLEQMTLDFVVHHLRPWLVAYEQACNRALLLQREKDSGYFVENLIDGLLRGDLTTRYNAYSIGKQNGWLSTNDILRMENKNTIGPKGDVYMVPLNMSVLGDDGMPVAVSNAGTGEPNTPARDLGGVRFLMADAADRIGKREGRDLGDASRKGLVDDEWASRYYGETLPEFMRTVLRPFVQGGYLTERAMGEKIREFCELRQTDVLSNQTANFPADVFVSLLEA